MSVYKVLCNKKRKTYCEAIQICYNVLCSCLGFNHVTFVYFNILWTKEVLFSETLKKMTFQETA